MSTSIVYITASQINGTLYVGAAVVPLLRSYIWFARSRR